MPRTWVYAPRREGWTTCRAYRALRESAALARMSRERERLLEELRDAEWILEHYDEFRDELLRRGVTRERLKRDIERLRLELYGLTGMAREF